MFKRLIFVTYLIGLAFFAFNYREVADWWVLRSYSPEPAIAGLADTTTMTDHGRKVFYVTDPALNDKPEFNANCPVMEKTMVLGCYSRGRIYLLDVEEPKLDGVVDVTAAHEMLHAAYERLGRNKREDVNKLLTNFYAGVTDKKLVSLVANYPEEVLLNELHSILPTQVIELTPELEEYYSQYFTNRRKVAEIYQDYEAVFESIQQQLENLQTEVKSIRARLTALESQINQKKAEIEAINAEMRRKRAQGDTSGYNAMVSDQNQAVREYNAMVEQYRGLVALHNQKVAELNELVLTQNDLVDSMDSRKFDEL